MLNDRAPLDIFERGTVTLQRYCREVILNPLRLFRGVVVSDFLFMDNTVHPHRNAEISNTLKWKIFNV